IMDFEEESKRMRLIALNPGVTVEQVVENTGFELLIADNITENAAPSDEELRVLREEVDKDKLYI
ncbi:3-oxoacid CoA-transferase, partial [bacterium]|nr:3-oxoacid CoA-transferase [bacterium]MBU1917103.1 3-oxoacid CoA-transferase [bacterium]